MSTFNTSRPGTIHSEYDMGFLQNIKVSGSAFLNLGVVKVWSSWVRVDDSEGTCECYSKFLVNWNSRGVG